MRTRLMVGDRLAISSTAWVSMSFSLRFSMSSSLISSMSRMEYSEEKRNLFFSQKDSEFQARLSVVCTERSTGASAMPALSASSMAARISSPGFTPNLSPMRLWMDDMIVREQKERLFPDDLHDVHLRPFRGVAHHFVAVLAESTAITSGLNRNGFRVPLHRRPRHVGSTHDHDFLILESYVLYGHIPSSMLTGTSLCCARGVPALNGVRLLTS